MNDRFKELILQSAKEGDARLDFIDTEKFAELIVRECIDVCENGWAGEFTICGIRQCVEDLKKHFGVE